MADGYIGKILNVDLTNKEFSVEVLSEELKKDFIGGSGLGTKFLFELTDKNTDPFGKNNVLIFMTGPLTGTKAFSSDRFSVITKSPLTNIYGESSCGGKWGSTLKKSGFDGIIIKGIAKSPVNIFIDNGNIKIEDASDIWGKDTFETEKILKKRTVNKAEVACIGPAGEKLVRFANIVTQGSHSRVAGRIGCGAVMGSKNLKAIIVNGNNPINVNDPKGLDKYFKEHAKELSTNQITKIVREYGTSGAMEALEIIGNVPIKNWSEIHFKDAKKVSGQELVKRNILKKRYYCGGCLIGCGRTISIEKGRFKTDGLIGGPEYESASLLGPNLLISDIEAVCKFNEICNRYGFDTISGGSSISMAMEALDKGLIDKDFLDGIELKWGNIEGVIAMLVKIGEREGVGKLLGEGTRTMAEEIGGFAIELAPQVKGNEIAGHDPRAKMGSALGNATSNRGACHMAACTGGYEDGGVIEGMGFKKSPGRFDINRKAEFVMKWQNLFGMYDSITCCKFIVDCGVGLSQIVKIFNLVTGFNFSNDEFLKAGERIFNLKRLYNNMHGITRKDDKLPGRFLMHIKEQDDFGHKFPPLNKMLSEYYDLRGWDEFGIPTKEKINELNLNKEYIKNDHHSQG